MLVKKIFVLAPIGVVTSVALAGGLNRMSVPVQPMFQPQLYIDANVGYAQANWQNYQLAEFGTFASLPGAIVTNGSGGFVGGGDVGYRFTRYLGAELGAYYLPEAEFSIPDAALGESITNWTAYLAAKINIPFFVSGLDFFGKVGVAYRSFNISTNGSLGPMVFLSAVNLAAGGEQFWTPMFGVGFQYFVTPSCSVNGQWMYVGGYANENPLGRQAPVTNLFTAGAGYQFAV